MMSATEVREGTVTPDPTNIAYRRSSINNSMLLGSRDGSVRQSLTSMSRNPSAKGLDGMRTMIRSRNNLMGTNLPVTALISQAQHQQLLMEKDSVQERRQQLAVKIQELEREERQLEDTLGGMGGAAVPAHLTAPAPIDPNTLPKSLRNSFVGSGSASASSRVPSKQQGAHRASLGTTRTTDSETFKGVSAEQQPYKMYRSQGMGNCLSSGAPYQGSGGDLPTVSDETGVYASNRKRAKPYVLSNGDPTSTKTAKVPSRKTSPIPREERMFKGLRGRGKHKRGASTYDLVKGFDPHTGAKTLNQYVRVAKIGEGSYGKVSLFRNVLDGRYYAIKVLNRELLQRKRVAPGVTAFEDVMREVRILKRLQHEHLVRVIETINDPGSPKMYMIMDYLAGGTILTPPHLVALPNSELARPNASAHGTPSLAPPALAKIRSHTTLPHLAHSQANTRTNTPREGGHSRKGSQIPGHHRATSSVEDPHPLAPGAPPGEREGVTGTANAPGSTGRDGWDTTESLLFHPSSSRRLHKQWGSSHSLLASGSGEVNVNGAEAMAPRTASGSAAGNSAAAPPHGPLTSNGGGNHLTREHTRNASRHISQDPSALHDGVAVTLNFGGVSLAADSGAQAQKMVEPEIADDGILLPPFGPLPEDVIKHRLRGVLEGLAFLHANGVAHNDVKPQNLLLTIEGTVKITDLSCSIEFDPKDPRGPFTTRAPGTPLFTAPECCSEEPFDATKADVWSVGVTAFAMAYGRVPFFAHSPYEIYEHICDAPVVWPTVPAVSPGLRALIASMLEKDPSKRPPASKAATHPWLLGTFVEPASGVVPRRQRNGIGHLLSRISERISMTLEPGKSLNLGSPVINPEKSIGPFSIMEDSAVPPPGLSDSTAMHMASLSLSPMTPATATGTMPQ